MSRLANESIQSSVGMCIFVMSYIGFLVYFSIRLLYFHVQYTPSYKKCQFVLQ